MNFNTSTTLILSCCNTRLHSSRMRTVRCIFRSTGEEVYPSMHWANGVCPGECLPKGGVCPRGVSAQGGCLPKGDVYLDMLTPPTGELVVTADNVHVVYHCLQTLVKHVVYHCFQTLVKHVVYHCLQTLVKHVVYHCLQTLEKHVIYQCLQIPENTRLISSGNNELK